MIFLKAIKMLSGVSHFHLMENDLQQSLPSRNNAKIWDVKTGKQIIFSIGHSSPLTSVTFAPNGELFVTGGFSDVINLWNLMTGKNLSFI